MIPREIVERVRAALLEAASRAYENAGIQGLCEEGRWEAAIDAIRSASLAVGKSGPDRGRKLAHLDPPELPDWSSLFSQVVVAEGSPLRIVITSGQVGVEANKAVPGDGSFEAQVEQAFDNLAVALSAADCSAADVAKLTIYVVDYEQRKVGAIRNAVTRHFGARSLPACTLVGVQALGRPEFLIEVEALAIAAPAKGGW